MPPRLVELHCGDALIVLSELPDSSVDAVITDPPYSSGGTTARDRMRPPSTKYVQTGTKLARPEFAGDNRDQRSFGYWSALWLGECLRVAKPGSPICVFTDWRQLPTTTDALQAGGWLWRGLVVWHKPNGRPGGAGRRAFRNQAEYVAWGSKGPLPARDQPAYLPGVITAQTRRHADKHHLTGKPTALMDELVRVTPPGGVILDPFMGSGTTGVAAVRNGYSFVGVECEPAYHAIATARIAEAITAAA